MRDNLIIIAVALLSTELSLCLVSIAMDCVSIRKKIEEILRTMKGENK